MRPWIIASAISRASEGCSFDALSKVSDALDSNPDVLDSNSDVLDLIQDLFTLALNPFLIGLSFGNETLDNC